MLYFYHAEYTNLIWSICILLAILGRRISGFGFVYFISIFDALFNVIQIATQTLIRSKTRLQTPTACLGRLWSNVYSWVNQRLDRRWTNEG